MLEQRCSVFRACLWSMQIPILAGRIDWVGIVIDSTRVLATFMGNFGILLRIWKFYWSNGAL